MYEPKHSYKDSENTKLQQRRLITKSHERNKNLIELSSLDIPQIEDSSIDAAAEYFCMRLSSLHEYFLEETIPFELIPFLMTLSRDALQLSIRKLKFGVDCTKTISALQKLAEKDPDQQLLLDKDKLVKMQSSFPIKQQNLLQMHKNDLKFIEVAHSSFNSQPISLDFIIHYSLYFASIELNPPQCQSLDLINSHDAWCPEIAEEISEHIINFDNIDSLLVAIHKLPSIDNPFNYLLLRYLYESIFKCHLPTHFTISNLYSKLITEISSTTKEIDVDSLLPVFIHVSGDPIEIPLSLDSKLSDFSLFGTILSFCHLTVRKPFKGPIPAPLPLCCTLAAIQRGNKEVLNRHIQEMIQIGIYVISHFIEVSPLLYSLIRSSLKGDVNSARELLRYPECISYLHPDKSRLHRLVYTLLSNDIDLPNTDSISIQMATSILRVRQLKQELPLSYVTDILRISHEKLTGLTGKLCGQNKNKIHLLFGGFSINQNIRVFSMKLKSPSDFISTAADNSFESIALTIMTMLPFIPKNIPQKDDIMCNILADMSLHYCLGDKLHTMIINHFSDTFAKSRQERQVFHVISSLEEKSRHEQTLSTLASQIGDLQGVQLLEAVTSHFIRTCDTESVSLIIRIFDSKMNRINISMRIDIFELLIKNGLELHEDILNFCRSLANSCDQSSRHSFFRILGMFSLSRSANVLAVLESIPTTIDDVVDIIESLPHFAGELPNTFIAILKKVTDKLPFFKFFHQRNKLLNQPFQTAWKEDQKRDQKETLQQSIDPWEQPTTVPVCSAILPQQDESSEQQASSSSSPQSNQRRYQMRRMNATIINSTFSMTRTTSPAASPSSSPVKSKNASLPLFCCNTCGLSGICQSCALTCHALHDVAFVGYVEITDASSSCSCFNNGRGCACMSKHLESGDLLQVPQQLPESVSYVPYVPGTPAEARVSSQTLVRLALSLSKSQPSSNEDCIAQPQQPSLSVPVNELNLETMKKCSVIKSHFSFMPVDKIVSSSSPLADTKNIASAVVKANENQQQLAKRLSVSPLKISAVSGEFLIVAEGTKLKSFKIATIKSNSISSNGSMTLSEASSIAIPAPALSISLSPLDPNIIAVATLRRALIYTLNPGDGTFSLMNEIELMLDSLGPNIFLNSIHWIPLAPLHIAVVCNNFVKVYDVPTDCIAPISCIVPNNSNDSFTSAVFVEHENECIGFLALSSGQIAIQNMFEDSGNGTQKPKLFVKMPGIPLQPIISYCPESDLLFITGPGAVMKTVRLEDLLLQKSKSAISINYNQLPGELFFLETLPTNSAYHIFVHPNSGSLVSIEFTDGGIEIAPLNSQYARTPINALLENRMQILSTFSIGNFFYAIESGGTVSSLKYGEVESDREIDIQYRVPATFWTRSTVMSTSVQMKAPGYQENCRLFNGDRLNFTSPNTPKVVEVSSTNMTQLIVGFCITVKSTPPPKGSYVICHGRSTPLFERVSIPLRMSEVKSRATHTIEFYCPSSQSLTVDRIDVHFIDMSTFLKIPANSHMDFDWRTASSSLFDFVDDNRRSGNVLHTICSHCILSIVADQADIDTENVRELVRVMYREPELGNAARSAICRISKDRNRFAMLWAKQLNEMINNNDIHESQWEVVWRDYQLMPNDCKQVVQKAIWEKTPNMNGIDPFVSAFL
ncbi:hypothetical protein M9Y10_002922 [Tritrichomonas musculus]|uniref:UBR-type domain-containing protein n=1 Tax=Tritrichomonas musculus TaxID=1915356 RepID=A0ABR2LB78_9EUKA